MPYSFNPKSYNINLNKSGFIHKIMNYGCIYTLSNLSTGEFPNIKGARNFLEVLLGEKVILPVVIGRPKSENDRDLMVHYLPPLRNTDRLTIETYLEGLRNLEGQENTSKFKSFFIYRPLKDLNKSRAGTLILSVSVIESDNEKGLSIVPRFGLSCFLGSQYLQNESDTIEGFTAESEVVMTRLQLACQKFVGPNRSG